MNLTPWDVQSKQIYTTDGVAPTLYSGQSSYWGGQVMILVQYEENDDSSSNKNEFQQV